MSCVTSATVTGLVAAVNAKCRVSRATPASALSARVAVASAPAFAAPRSAGNSRALSMTTYAANPRGNSGGSRRGLTKFVERVNELQPAPADPGMVLPAQLQRRILGNAVAGLVDPLLARKHQPGQDQRLGARTRVRQPAFHQRKVCACL